MDAAFDRDLIKIRYENLDQTLKKVNKTKRRKLLGLIDKDQIGEGQFFSEREVGEAIEAFEEAEAERSQMEQERRDKREEQASRRVFGEEEL